MRALGDARAILFDLDNTLIDRDAAFLAWVRPRVPEAAVEALAALDAGGHGPRPDVFRAIADLTGAPFGAVQRAFFAEIGACCRLREDAAEVLRRLRGRVPVAIVTNGDSAVQRSKIAGAGVADLVDAIVVSGEVGDHKPAPDAFLAAMAALGAPTPSVWMVGDHPVNDVFGAATLGLGTVWVRTRWFASCPQADLQASDLRELAWPGS